MKKIAFITDSTFSPSPEMAKQYDIFVLPMNLSFEQETFKDGIDITEEQFFEKLSTSATLPKSSQPNFGEMVELYENLKKNYDGGIAIHVSSALSGTASSSKQAAEMAGFPLALVDSQSISLPIGQLITEGHALLQQGHSLDETASKLQEKTPSIQFYAMIGSLDQLHKGGRVNTLQLMMGSLLQIKPIMALKEGKLVPHDKVRTHKKALMYMVNKLKEAIDSGASIDKAFILHANAKEDTLTLQAKLLDLFPSLTIEIGSIGTAASVHTGAGTVGLSWFQN